MKKFFTGFPLAALLLAACQTASTQAEPQVIAVPVDEMSRPPSLGPATTGQLEAPVPQASPALASLPKPAQPAASKHSYNSCNVDGPYIAMTFDDGPHPELTPRLLDELKKRNLKATFYVVGRNVEEYPEIVKRMADEGHEVANHTWSHPALPKLGAEGVRKQMNDTTAAIRKACGVTPVTMRPPYGATNAGLNRRMAEDYGMKVILWSVDPQDWKYRKVNHVYTQIVEKAHPGAIILAHDIHATTVAAMPQTFDTLLAKGYKFVTVSELLAMDRPPQLVKKEPGPTPSAP
jgi:peptidoglycan/xylan/chitin deacetylase (PgdA/CDA1 family)